MLRNYFTLYHAAMELQEQLAGGYLFEIHTQQKNEITIAFVTPDGRHLQLIVTVHSPFFSIHSKEGLNRKQRNTAGIMNLLCEHKIMEVSIPPGDRQILFILDDGHTLVLRMFSAETNLLLVRDGLIIDAFKEARKLENTPFSITAATEPVFRTLELLAHSPRAFVQKLQAADGNGSGQEPLLSILPGFDRKLVRRLIDSAENETPEALHTAFVNLFYDLASPTPCVIESADQPPAFSLFQPTDSEPFTPFDRVLDALNHYSHRRYRYQQVQERAVNLRRTLADRIGRIEKELATGEPGMLKKKALQNETSGHLLTGAIGLVEPVSGEVSVPNLFEPGAPAVLMTINPQLNIQENAAWYFTQASKSRKKAAGMKLRHTALSSELAMLRQKFDELQSAASLDALQKATESAKPGKALAGGRNAAQKEKKAPPFRTIPLTGKITLYIGRSSANNEQLTFGFARPDDIWLHARGASGSHCVLRGAGMHNTTELRRAAEIAAWHSSARNSEMVPVICTQKKYIKKDRKISGNVIIERETVIMAKPLKELPG
ncbi:MAG: DUF814 domain-containing protein [Chlorobiaceae bacterium]|nr:DUF814 domain-containing protein [Chlorobiaceae bacterium]